MTRRTFLARVNNFEARTKDLAWIGSQHPEDHKTIRARHESAKNRLLLCYPASEELNARTIADLQRQVTALKPYKKELLRLAEAVGEAKDPFAAWETIEPALEAAKDAESNALPEGLYVVTAMSISRTTTGWRSAIILAVSRSEAIGKGIAMFRHNEPEADISTADALHITHENIALAKEREKGLSL